MDYCSTCRRHLNGALVCPGCGAYAPDIAPGVIGGRTVPGTATGAVEPTAVTAPAPGPASRPGDVPDDVPVTGVPAGPPLELPESSGTGRAARRRQLARWKKTQRRALVATAVALVGGGLTLTTMDSGTGDRTRAATAPDVKGMGGATGPADGSAGPGSPTVSPDRTPRPPSADDGSRAADTPTPAASTEPSRAPGTQAVATPAPRTSAPDSVSRSGERSEAGGGGGANTGQASEQASGAASGSGSGTAARPTPTPTPPAADTGGTDQGESPRPAPSTPPAAEPDSSQLCLLVICLG